MIMRGRPLRERVEVSPDAAGTWPALVDGARAYVDEITPEPRTMRMRCLVERAGRLPDGAAFAGDEVFDG
ncbi:hypothetical protein [Microbacterium sp. S16(2024)]|jgi:predicted NAD/FAD-binding protein